MRSRDFRPCGTAGARLASSFAERLQPTSARVSRLSRVGRQPARASTKPAAPQFSPQLSQDDLSREPDLGVSANWALLSCALRSDMVQTWICHSFITEWCCFVEIRSGSRESPNQELLPPTFGGLVDSHFGEKPKPPPLKRQAWRSRPVESSLQASRNPGLLRPGGPAAASASAGAAPGPDSLTQPGWMRSSRSLARAPHGVFSSGSRDARASCG